MVIIDTHVLIWILYDKKRLSDRAFRTLTENDVRISIVSMWELSIKKAKGMIELDETIPQISEKCADMALTFCT